MSRHSSVEAVTRFFEYSHLPAELANIVNLCSVLKDRILDEVGDDPELTVGLRKLLEAKDCFVRAKVAELNKVKGETHEGKPV